MSLFNPYQPQPSLALFHQPSWNNEQISGLYFLQPNTTPYTPSHRSYLPLVALSAHATILSSVSRTSLTQTFANPWATDAIPELRYTFPLYDGVSVVGFTCTINNDRVITGVVQEKQAARATFDAAVAQGQTAGLLEQLPDASDVFTTTVGNVPAGATIKIDIVVLGELKHDAEVDGIRFALPTRIAPRYGDPGLAGPQATCSGISIVVDVEMQPGSAITSLQSPSHPIGVTIGSHSSSKTATPSPQFNLASATLSLGTTSLDKDFVLQIMATNTSNPVAILETHPTIPNQRALMATFVPKFNLPSQRPEIVFVCDRSGSMRGQKMVNLQSALRLFLKSLPVGVSFNICSFGSSHSFLFPAGSRIYDADSLALAMHDVAGIDANYGGTELLTPIKATFDQRAPGMNLEVFVLTDGQIHDQRALFNMVTAAQQASQGSIRVFTLGIGDGASSALVEGLARAGNGFCQTVGDNEKLDKKVVRMLKAALTPHITDYTLEVKYRKSEDSSGESAADDDFEIIDRVADLVIDIEPSGAGAELAQDTEPKPISLFDPSVDMDIDSPSPLPTLAVPRILQTPFQLPTLFSFNRTTVYLLLSPDTATNTPETVILRATSAHGPLVLEIPVTTSSTGSTIHQLAARQATLELEEGRGWLFHAKDTKTGALLTETYPGRFSDLVQREAVRLGVLFQVGGKWCSLVAVEADGSTAQTVLCPSPLIQSGPTFARAAGGSALFGQSAGGGPATGPFDMPQTPAGFGGGLSGGTFKLLSRRRPTTYAQASASGSSSPAYAMHPKKCRRDDQEDEPLVPARVFSHDTAAAGGGRASPDARIESSSRGARFRRAPSEHSEPSSPEYSVSASFVSSAASSSSVPTTTNNTETPLETIVRLQSFEGFWSWSAALCAAIGQNPEDIIHAANAQDVISAPAPDVWATAEVLRFLETTLADECETWELMADKARAWLKTREGEAVEGMELPSPEMSL